MDEDTLQLLLSDVNDNYGNAKYEIKEHTLTFLEKHRSDNILELLKNASNRGYSAVEWIDLWGVGGMNSKITIKWANDVIKEKNLDQIIEPYYNNIHHRLGITIKRNLLSKRKIMALPMELRNKTISRKLHIIIEDDYCNIDKSIIFISDDLP